MRDGEQLSRIRSGLVVGGCESHHAEWLASVGEASCARLNSQATAPRPMLSDIATPHPPAGYLGGHRFDERRYTSDARQGNDGRPLVHGAVCTRWTMQ